MTAPASGPRVVAIGGGHGLAATIRAVRRYAGRTTAVVATADDGGSTGRLRGPLGLPAPGDLRVCLAAMVGESSCPLAAALDYRFGGTDVEGHALGNLLLAGLADALGDFAAAVDELAGLVGLDPAVGRVVPATAAAVVLRAETAAGAEVTGQVALYTSVLAAVAVDDVREALKQATGPLVYVCNVRAQAEETRSYDVADHVAALRRHGVEPDVVLVQRGALPRGEPHAEIVEADVVRPHGLAHDPAKLAEALRALSAG
jgi:2-phospho-L-lactate transferase/gluconeogenesis factor (CofD/UPF0052 family)